MLWSGEMILGIQDQNGNSHYRTAVESCYAARLWLTTVQALGDIRVIVGVTRYKWVAGIVYHLALTVYVLICKLTLYPFPNIYPGFKKKSKFGIWN